jgi:hypothetical protein
MYPHIALFDAAAMAAGKPGSSVAGWHLFPVPAPFTTCGPAGLQNPDGSCPDPIIQPTLAHADPKASYFVAFENELTLVIWKVTNQLHPTVQSTEVPTDLMRVPSDAPQKGTTDPIAMSNLDYSPLKAVWAAGALYIVSNDADQSLRAIICVLRLPTSDWPHVPSPLDVNSGADQVLGGTIGTSSFGWPAIDVAPGGDAVIVYTRVGPLLYADIRYNAWPHNQKEMLGGRILKYGEAPEVATAPATSTRWGDLAGASVDFENGKETPAVWITHEYALSAGGSPTTQTWRLGRQDSGRGTFASAEAAFLLLPWVEHLAKSWSLPTRGTNLQYGENRALHGSRVSSVGIIPGHGRVYERPLGN